MVLKTIDLEKNHVTLEQVLAELERNSEILLTRGTDPIATVASLPPTPPLRKRVLGLHEGQGWMSDDFNDPLTDEFWLGNDQ
jgi:antitoxin (DNA-binding transcriptional repressor) of toxin-antitoxin stability system